MKASRGCFCTAAAAAASRRALPSLCVLSIDLNTSAYEGFWCERDDRLMVGLNDLRDLFQPK